MHPKPWTGLTGGIIHSWGWAPLTMDWPDRRDHTFLGMGTLNHGQARQVGPAIPGGGNPWPFLPDHGLARQVGPSLPGVCTLKISSRPWTCPTGETIYSRGWAPLSSHGVLTLSTAGATGLNRPIKRGRRGGFHPRPASCPLGAASPAAERAGAHSRAAADSRAGAGADRRPASRDAEETGAAKRGTGDTAFFQQIW